MYTERMFTLKKISYCILIIIIAAFSFRAGGMYWQSRDKDRSATLEREILYYIDPMTPGYRSEKPGIAPCGMPLEPVYAESGGNQESYADGVVSLSAGAVKVSPARQQLIGMNVSPVELQPMTSHPSPLRQACYRRNQDLSNQRLDRQLGTEALRISPPGISLKKIRSSPKCLPLPFIMPR